MALATGTRLGPYGVVASLGAGGMGEVYKAHDTQLKRDVALKILPSHLALDPERLARFDREAQALAALNHPRIAQVYGVVHHGDVRAIAMELVEGPTLAERIARGSVPIDEALGIAVQLADTLEYAHERGVVHRDLKPANIKLTPDGAVKVLDFGLAKVLEQPAPGQTSELLANSPTITSPVMSRVGVILGTAAYMAPEQARGAAVDKRADIWAFGVVLFEMLTGKPCFTGETVTDVLAAVITSEPDWGALPAGTPQRLRELLRRCLAKDRKQRLQAIGDGRIELEEIRAGAESQMPAHPSIVTRRTRRAYLLGTVSVLALAVGIGVFVDRAGIGRVRPVKFTRLTFQRGYITNARFGTDGREVFYSAGWEGRPPELFDTRIDAAITRPLDLSGVALLSVSNNGELAVRRRAETFLQSESGPLAVAPPSGSAPRDVLDDVSYADWSGQAVVRRAGGEDRLEMPPGRVLARTVGQFADVRVSRDGGHVALTEHPFIGDGRGTVVLVDADARKTTLTREFNNVHGLAWSPDGREIWFSAAVDGGRQSLYAVTPQGRMRTVAQFPTSVVLLDVTSDGRLLMLSHRYQAGIRGRSSTDNKERELSWLDLAWLLQLSPDGRTLLFDDEGDTGGAGYTVYTRTTDGSLPIQLGKGAACALSPEGRWVLAIRVGTPQRLALIPTGAGETIFLPRGQVDTYQNASFLPDGRRIVFVGAERGRPQRIWVQDVSGGQPRPATPEVAVATFGRQGVTTSPDGRSVAAVTQESQLTIFPLEGGAPRSLGTVKPNETVCQWSDDARTLYGYRWGKSLDVFDIEAETGVRRPWKTVELPDPAGALMLTFVMTRDGRSYAYGYLRWLDELYVVEGLK